MLKQVKDKINRYRDSHQRRQYLWDKVKDGEVAIPLERFLTKYAEDEGAKLLAKIARNEASEEDMMRYRVLTDVKNEIDSIIRTAKMKHDALQKMKEDEHGY